MTDIVEFDEDKDAIERGVIEAQVKQQLAADVQSKINEMIHGGVGRQVIEMKDALNYLVARVGAELTTVLCSITSQDLKAFRRVKPTRRGPKTPTPIQARNIAAAYLIVDVLVSAMDPGQAREWLVSYDEYLFGIPAIELRSRPEDVRMAALHLIMGGS